MQTRESGTVDTMTTDPAPALRRHWIISGSATAIVLLGGAAFGLATRKDEPVCTEDAGRHLLGVWDRAQRAIVRARVLALKDPAAEAGWTRTAAALDDHAETWTIAYSTICDTLAKDDEDPALLAQRRCLQWRLRQLAATAQILREAEPPLLRVSQSAAHALDPIEDCEDARRAARVRPWPNDDDDARHVQGLRIRLDAHLIADRAGLLDAIEQLGGALGKDSLAVASAREALTALDR